MVSLHMGLLVRNHLLVVWLLVALDWKEHSVCGEVPEEKSNTEKLFTKTTVLDRISYLYNNSIMSDMKLTCGDKMPGEVFFAHKYILAATSPVFYERFYGESLTNISSVHLSNISDVNILASFLSFLYRDECPTDVEAAFKVLGLTMKYKISSFAAACKDYLQPKITAERAFTLLESLTESKAEALADVSWGLIDTYPNDFFSSEHFLNINKTTLDALLERETLCCDEMTIFKAVMKWLDNQCGLNDMRPTRENRRKILGDSIYKIRFLVMEQSEFIKNVGGELLTDLEVIAIVKFMNGLEVPDLKWNPAMLKRPGSCGYRLLSARLWFGIATILISIIGGVVCLNNRRPYTPNHRAQNLNQRYSNQCAYR